MSAAIVTGVLSAVADSRTSDLRYRQRQLISLHRWISKHLVDAKSAVTADDGLTDSETRFVISLALDELRRSYDSLDLKKELDVEFRIMNGRDNADRRLSVNIVYVIPESYTLFYSVMSALCLSVAAGSCCVIELPRSLRRTSGLLVKMISESLDNLAFLTTSTRPSDNFLKQCLVIDQQNCISPTISKWLVRSQATRGAVAVVDRTADVATAAKAIATSMFLFDGRGPYAPTCILVNEFVEQEFCRLFEQHGSAAVPDTSRNCDRPKSAHKQHAVNGNLSRKLTASKDACLKRITKREEIDITRDNNIRGSVLLAVTSLDDAIDFISSKISSPLLASYIFAEPKSAKYLAQFIRADVSFVNHIPTSLLVGPAAPSGYAASPTARYRTEMIELPSPQFVHCLSGSTSFDVNADKDSVAEDDLLTASLKPLKSMGQPREGDMNFFVQGLRASFALFIYMPMTLAAIAIGTYGARLAYKHWR